MPYRIRHGSGKRPFEIVNLQTGKVVGTSASRQMAQGSINHRLEGEKKDFKSYKRVVNNKLPYYGESDTGKRIAKINKKMAKKNPMHKRPLHKKARTYPEVLDSIVHEKMHVEHPKRLETTVRKVTKKKIKSMSTKQKRKHYSLFKG